MTFNDFNNKFILKEKGTTKIIIQQVLSSVSLNDVRICLGDEPVEYHIGIVNLHPFRGTHWVLYINENSFDSYGCAPPIKLSNFKIKGIGHCLHYEHKIQDLTKKEILLLLLMVYT